MIKVIELTKENEKEFLNQIANLEDITLDVMKGEGREGQFFATGKEDISEYVHSQENTVVVATDENGIVQATAYVTQGQKPFTYNDITKYFKSGDDYRKYVKSQYSDNEEYKRDLLDIYQIKLQAYQYAKIKILQEYQSEASIAEFLQREVEENGFHEKSELREKLNRYMSAYVIENFGEEIQKKYEQFYWITAEDISQEFGRDIKGKKKQIQEYEKFLEAQLEYEQVLKHSGLTIHEEPQFDISKYFTANTQNAVELDTYITMPNSRSSGLARIIVFEGIKKHMQKHFANPENKEIFLCSTLHRDNLSSKYVSEFFGLTDSLYVKRRQGRDREVHICKIAREEAMEYIMSISDRLAVLYGYNPDSKKINRRIREKVLKEQLIYEETEYKRLVRARRTDKAFKGINLKFIDSKMQKIRTLKRELESLEKEEEGDRDE